MHSTKVFTQKKKHLLLCFYEGSAYKKWEGCVWIFSRPIAMSCRLYLLYKLIWNNFRVKILYSNQRSDSRTCVTNKYRDYRHHWWVIGEWLADRMETILNTNENALRSSKRTEQNTYFHWHVEWFNASNENRAKPTSVKICIPTCRVVFMSVRKFDVTRWIPNITFNTSKFKWFIYIKDHSNLVQTWTSQCMWKCAHHPSRLRDSGERSWKCKR